MVKFLWSLEFRIHILVVSLEEGCQQIKGCQQIELRLVVRPRCYPLKRFVSLKQLFRGKSRF